MQHSFSDGKYTVINDNGKLTALRHGEPWDRDLTGDNLIYWMLVDVDALKAQRDELVAHLQKSVASLEWAAAIIGDMPPKCEYLESLREAKEAIAKATGEAT